MLLTVFIFSFALMLAGIFFYAGLSKWQAKNHQFYTQAIDSYQLTPTRWSSFLVKPLAITEMSIAMLLLLPITHKAGLILAAFILSVYLFALAKQLHAGQLGMACGCAGPASELTVSSALLLRNTILLGLSLAASATVVSSNQELWLFALPLVLPAAAIFGLIYLSSEQLLSNNQKIQALRLSGL